MSDILSLIKNNGAVRKYTLKKISQKVLSKIIDSGRWALSIHGFQPWKIVVVTNKEVIKKIFNILKKKHKIMGIGSRILLRVTADAIIGANAIIIVLNTNAFVNMAIKFGKSQVKLAKLSEIEAIGASIQNMLLTANSLNVGGCWTVAPLFFEKEIKMITGEEGSIMAILCLGYPAEKRDRSPRKPFNETVRYIR
jgi:nitroreductase